MTTTNTRKQAHVGDVEASMRGLTEALAQLALSGVPPEASIAVTTYMYAGKVLIAADWEVRS